jgi:hypothetical protein
MLLAQNRDWWVALVNTVMNLRVQYIVGIFLSDFANGGFSRRAQPCGGFLCLLLLFSIQVTAFVA